jgi:peroxiredoxin
MEDTGFPKKKKFSPVPFVLVFGFILGGILSWVLAPQSSPAPVHTTTTAPKPAPTHEFLLPTQMMEITPQVLYQSSVATQGQAAPDFTLKAVDGKEIKLSDYTGRPILINFWATWCPPCEYEMPGIQAAYEKYKDQGLAVLSVNFTAEDKLNDVQNFIPKYQLTFPVLLDQSGDVTAKMYGMVGLPMSVFIGRDGVIQRIEVGGLQEDKVDQYIQEILPEKPALTVELTPETK